MCLNYGNGYDAMNGMTDDRMCLDYENGCDATNAMTNDDRTYVMWTDDEMYRMHET